MLFQHAGQRHNTPTHNHGAQISQVLHQEAFAAETRVPALTIPPHWYQQARSPHMEQSTWQYCRRQTDHKSTATPDPWKSGCSAEKTPGKASVQWRMLKPRHEELRQEDLRHLRYFPCSPRQARHICRQNEQDCFGQVRRAFEGRQELLPFATRTWSKDGQFERRCSS